MAPGVSLIGPELYPRPPEAPVPDTWAFEPIAKPFAKGPQRVGVAVVGAKARPDYSRRLFQFNEANHRPGTLAVEKKKNGGMVTGCWTV